MKFKMLVCFGLVLGIVLFSYGSANAQVVDAVKKAASKTKDVTVGAAKKTGEVTKDVAVKTGEVVTEDIPDKTVDVAKASASGAKTGTRKAAHVVKTGFDESVEGGRWLTVKTWDGAKWVSKKVLFGAKKVGTTTKKVVVGDEKRKP